MSFCAFCRRYCPLSVVASLLILWLCLMPVPEVERIPLFPGFDKMVHGAFYAVLTVLILWESRRILLAIVWSVVWGGVIEILQAHCTHGLRSGEWADWWADVLGALVVAGVYHCFNRWKYGTEKTIQ